MNKDLIAIFEYLEREKGISRDVVVNAIKESLQIAAKKNIVGASNITVNINPKTGNIDVFSEKQIVDKVKFSTKEISLEAAKEIDPDCEIGQYIDVIVTPEDFGRIAAQKARQIITQKLRNAERDVIYEEYRHRINELVTGIVKRFVRGALVIDLGKVEAIMPLKHYPKIEKYKPGDRIFALIYEVQDTDIGGAELILTRSHPEFVKQLFVQEIPEIADSIINIVKIVREPGYKTKIIVESTDSKIDPIGACIGVRGNRIKNVMREINNEKIDVIQNSDNPIEILRNALSPHEIRKAFINEKEKIISIVVDDDSYPSVIGKKGFNARLNSELIGYELEIRRKTEYDRSLTVQRMQLAESDDPSLDEPLKTLEGINKLIIENLIAEGYTTPRLVLMATPEKLAAVPGISLEMADKIFNSIKKEGNTY